MKSISTIIVNDWKQKHLISFCDCESNYIRNRAKQHAETCQIILDEWRDFNKGKDLNKKWTFEEEVLSWCNSEIKILTDGGLL